MALGQIVIDLELSIAKFVSNIGKVNSNLGSLQKSVNTIKGASFVYLGQQVLQAAESVYQFTRGIASSASEIERNAKTIGISISAYQKLAYAAKMSDVEMGSMMVGLRSLSQNMNEASQGSGDAAMIFESLGISIKDTAGNVKSLDQMLLEITDSLTNVIDPSEKIAIAVKLMGRSAMDLVPYFNQGRRAIEDFYKTAKVATDEAIKKGAEAEGEFKHFEASIEVAKKAIGPTALEFAKFLNDIVQGYAQIEEGFDKNLAPTYEKWGVWIKTLHEQYMQLGEDVGAITPYPKSFVAPPLPEKAERPWRTQAALKPYFTPMGQIKAVAKATEEIVEQNYKLSDLYEYDKNMLAAIVREADNLNEATSKTRAIIEQITKLTGSWKNYFTQGKMSAWEYVDAIKAVSDQLKDLTTRDQQMYDKKEEAEEEYQATIKAIPADAEDRQKRVNKAVDEYFKKIKEAEKLKLPTHLDVEPALRELNDFIKTAEAKGIILPVTVQKTEEGGGGISWTDYVGGKTEFFQGGKDAIQDMSDSFQDFRDQWGQGLDIPISISGIGSSKKPITDKIKEIIDQFGGLDKALSGMEANINVAELSMERTQLQRQIDKLNEYWVEWRKASSIAGSFSFGPGGNDPIVKKWNEQMEDLTQQMKILQMKMEYETFKGYGGSMQSGGIVQRTGLYKLHEGEKVISKSITSNPVYNFNISGQDPKGICNEIAKQLKYKRSGALAEAIR